MNVNDLFNRFSRAFTITNRNFVLALIQLDEVCLVSVSAAGKDRRGIAIALVNDLNITFVNAFTAAFTLKLDEAAVHGNFRNSLLCAIQIELRELL